MTRTIRSIGVACLSSVAIAAGASAQTITPADPGRTAGWVFTPSLSASTAWDDNVTLAGRRSPTVSDVVTLFSGTADGQYTGRFNTLSFGYTGSFSAYRELTDLNSFDQHLRVETRHVLAPHVTLTLHNDFSKVPTTDYVELTGVPFLRTGSLVDAARAALTVAVGPHTSVNGGYSFEWVKFDDNTLYTEFLKGGHSNNVFGGITRQLTDRISLGGSVSFRRALVASGGGQFDISETSGNVKYQATETLTLSGSGGLSRLSDSLRHTSQLGPVWGVAATQELKRASLTVVYDRSYVPTFGLGGTVQNQEFDANFHMPFSKNRVYWEAGLSWRRNEPLVPGEHSLKSLWFATSGGYSIQRWLRVEGYYARTQQDSQLAGGRVDRDRIGVQAVTSTPMRLK